MRDLSLLTFNNVPRPMVPPNSGIMAIAEQGAMLREMLVNVTPLSVTFYVF